MDLKIILFSLLAFIILIPILFALPLNVTRKGKFTILILSFVTAASVLVLKTFLTLWQNILLMIAILLLFTLILTKKFSALFFTASESTMEEQKEKQIEKPVPKKLDLGNKSSKTKDLPIVTPIQEEIPLKEDGILDQTLDQETIHPISDRVDKDKPALESVPEENEEWTENELEDLLVDRLEEMNTAVSETDNDEENNNDLTETVQLSYLPELEEMMLHPEQDGEDSSKEWEIDEVREYGELELLFEEWSKSSGEQVAVAVDTATDTIEENEPSLNQTGEHMETIEGKKEMMIEVQEKNEEEASENNLTAINTQDVEESLAEMDHADDHASEKQIQETIVELSDPMVEEETENVQNIEQIDEASLNDKEMKKREQVLTTMYLQAEIAQNTLENEQYEQLLLNYIDYHLPAQDLFPFAVLLLEHYSEINNIDAFEKVMNQLNEEFSEYPNLLQEIHYFQSNYVKK